MAVTYSGILNTVIGDHRMVIFDLTASASEEEIGSNYHGLSNIKAVTMGLRSGVTAAKGNIMMNQDSSGVASAGCIGLSGLVGAASSVLRVTAYGN